MLVYEATGARTLYLAASEGGNGFSDAGAAVDADGRHRLAQAAEDMGA